MQLRLYIFIGGLCFLEACSGQSTKKPSGQASQIAKKITVSFTIDDSLVAINDQFQILFANSNDTIIAKNSGTELLVPQLLQDTGYTVIFKYGAYTLPFVGITKKMIYQDQNVEWKFGIDNRPFNNLLGLLSTEEFNTDKKTRQLQYLQFNLLEQGDGIQIVNKIN